ncbi:hypothetical protein KAR91_07555 [Candidatus Pacearchaeota archaeon]|nr:hypothetical protein [Candidatus Pacearchaeota archaeon]
MKKTIPENERIKKWADELIPCPVHQEQEKMGGIVCPACGRLYKDVPILVQKGDPIRMYDKRHAVIGPQLYVAADGSDAIRIAKMTKTPPQIGLSRIPEGCIELFARPIELSDNTQTG